MSANTPIQQLKDLDDALLIDPDHVEMLYLRAALLANLGRNDEAKDGYIRVIAREPTHFGALNDLGTILHKTDFRTAARTAYAEAVRQHPLNPTGRINLGNALFSDGQWDASRAQLEAALRLAPEHPDVHQGLANVLQELGDWEAAELHRQQSYRSRSISVERYRGTSTPVRVLLLVSAVGGNVPTRFLLDDRTFETAVLVVESQISQTVLPDHDLVFNAVGDVDLCQAALGDVEALLERTKAPVINSPSSVRRTGRAVNAQSLGASQDVRTPLIHQVNRGTLTQAACTMTYPLLLRSPGFHTGRHFVMVGTDQELAAAALHLPGDDLLLIEYLDARDRLGRSRKYRVMLIGGEIFPLHLAISNDWKVHYFTADMIDQPDHRAEEADFLNDMTNVLGERVLAALHRLSVSLALDYAGVDFAVGEDGRLLVFEANATMVVNPPPPGALWDYRRPAVQRIFSAVQRHLTSRAGVQSVLRG